MTPSFDILCNTCSLLFQEPWDQEYTQSLAGLKMDFFKKPHHTLSSFQQAVKEGCHLCSLFSSEKSRRNLPASDQRLVIEMTHPKFGDGQRDWHLSVRAGQCTFDRLTLIPLDDVTDVVVNREVVDHTFNPASISRAKEWIGICSQTHTSCSDSASVGRSDLPTRLLRIGGEAGSLTTQLIETANIPDGYEYVTLSHCWGGAPGLKLLKENLNSLTSSIDFGSLPKSFSDALMLTKALNFDYLWIDSLCIIQDSAEDWAQESAKMGAIYTNSVLTIAATDSKSSLGGLFSTRASNLVDYPCIVRVTRGDPLPKHFLIVSPGKELGYAGSGPLNQRGWVLQERLLSRRLLQCTYTEFKWECTCLEASLTFPCGIFGQSSVDKSWFEKAAINQESWYEIWIKLRERYSAMDLTFGSDKLIAFSGIAQRMYDLNRSSEAYYLAGLWRPQLARDLLWINNPIGDEQPSVSKESYRAPSWSWAKTNRRVTFRYDKSVFDSAQCYVEVLSTSTTPSPLHTSFGQLSFGVIRIEGPLCLLQVGGRSCSLEPHQINMETLLRRFTEGRNQPSTNALIYDKAGAIPNSNPHIHTNGELLNHRSFATSACPNFWIQWDEESASRARVETATTPMELYFMPVMFQKQERLGSGSVPHPTGTMIVGLLLERVDGEKGRYTRVGILDLPASFDIFDRSLHSGTVGEDGYLHYDGNEQYTIEIV